MSPYKWNSTNYFISNNRKFCWNILTRNISFFVYSSGNANDRENLQIIALKKTKTNTVKLQNIEKWICFSFTITFAFGVAHLKKFIDEWPDSLCIMLHAITLWNLRKAGGYILNGRIKASNNFRRDLSREIRLN